MTAKFKDDSSNAGEITCKVSSSIIESQFALPPVRCNRSKLVLYVLEMELLTLVTSFLLAGRNEKAQQRRSLEGGSIG